MSLNKKIADNLALKAANAKLKLHFDKLVSQINFEREGPPSPDDVIKLHIKSLKEYNELRDTGLRLVQMIAEEKHCKLKEVFEEMGVEMLDD